MQFQELRIGLKNSFSKPGPNNPFVAKLQITYNDNTMIVQLENKTIHKIMLLVQKEIGDAAAAQMREFANAALSIPDQLVLEHEKDI